MPEINQTDWRTLVRRTRQRKLLPVISDQVTNRLFFDNRGLIQAWSDDIGYPLGHGFSITRLAQYLSIESNDDLVAKEEFLAFEKRHLLKTRAPSAAQKLVADLGGQLHRLRLAELVGRIDQAILDDELQNPLRRLAQLPVEIYITTGYHHFLEVSLRAAGKEPRTEICYWHPDLRPTSGAEAGLNPLVRLRDALEESYNLEELHDLAFTLNLEFSDLLGQGPKAKARELVQLLKRQDRLPDLVPVCREDRPGVPWDDLVGLATGQTDAEKSAGLPSVFTVEPNYDPTVDQPLVYHLLGLDLAPASMVFTEDDYLDFLVTVSADQEIIHHRVRQALSDSSLVLLGYDLQDWDFRVLFRGLIAQKRTERRVLSVAIQLTPAVGEDSRPVELRSAQSYLERYFDKSNFKIYWGSPQGFVQELWGHWEETP